MKILSIFSHAAQKEFAKSLVLQLSKELPPVLMSDRRKVLSVNKVTRLLERTYQAAASYQQEHQVGFIKRAVLANSFKWELMNVKYPDDFVEMATEGLVVVLCKPKDTSKESLKEAPLAKK
jgi:hypothetical protein